MNKKLTIIFVGLLMSTVLLVFLLIYTRKSIDQIMRQVDEQTYDSHYIMISEDTSDQWRAIYAAAKKAANETGVYLEWAGRELSANYEIEDYMRIATANRPDGIILHLGAGENVTELIDAATDKGIPVITLLEDDPDSSRVSFIGINSYQMGEIYGKQILENLITGENNITVLLNDGEKNSSLSLMYSQMMQVVEQGRLPEQKVNFNSHKINTTTNFDAEEDIRDIFLQADRLPNILICLDPISTECVCQAVVDYNEVGNVTVLGYSASDKVQESIRKGLIQATLMLDLSEIGNLCIEALNEFRELGHVSNYYNVGMQMITGKTLPKQNEQEQSEKVSLYGE